MLLPHVVQSCTTDEDCSLNGVCNGTHCACDAPWKGDSCGLLDFLPGHGFLDDKPLCVYHGLDANSTSWGGSVLKAPEDGKYYMWVAEMTNHCTLGRWRTNSAVTLAVSSKPEGPFERVRQLVPPWAHNPQAIRAPDPTHGHVYALYTLGDGIPSGPQANCNSTDLARTGVDRPPPPGPSRITANFTIHWATSAAGEYEKYTASILDWPSNWDFGAHGNWNPAPLVHPNGTIFLMAHTSWKAFCGEAIIRADTWRGPYHVMSSDTFSSWGGSTCGS